VFRIKDKEKGKHEKSEEWLNQVRMNMSKLKRISIAFSAPAVYRGSGFLYLLGRSPIQNPTDMKLDLRQAQPGSGYWSLSYTSTSCISIPQPIQSLIRKCKCKTSAIELIVRYYTDRDIPAVYLDLMVISEFVLLIDWVLCLHSTQIWTYPRIKPKSQLNSASAWVSCLVREVPAFLAYVCAFKASRL
jgi:hypothetical protein